MLFLQRSVASPGFSVRKEPAPVTVRRAGVGLECVVVGETPVAKMLHTLGAWRFRQV